MDIKSEYQKLYQHWLKEFRQIELTKLTKEQYNKYQEAADYLKNLKINQEEKIKNEIISSYKENFTFLLEDFSKIREIKLVNSALALQEINLNHILEAEKLFYQNLVSAIKGFEKVKVIEVVERAKSSKIIETINGTQQDAIQTKSSKIQDSSDLDIDIKPKTEDFNYTLIKFLKKAPPLVGIDLIKYGPFEKEDIANIPYKNAKILLTEKVAELIQHS